MGESLSHTELVNKVFSNAQNKNVSPSIAATAADRKRKINGFGVFFFFFDENTPQTELRINASLSIVVPRELNIVLFFRPECALA